MHVQEVKQSVLSGSGGGVDICFSFKFISLALIFSTLHEKRGETKYLMSQGLHVHRPYTCTRVGRVRGARG